MVGIWRQAKRIGSRYGLALLESGVWCLGYTNTEIFDHGTVLAFREMASFTTNIHTCTVLYNDNDLWV